MSKFTVVRYAALLCLLLSALLSSSDGRLVGVPSSSAAGARRLSSIESVETVSDAFASIASFVPSFAFFSPQSNQDVEFVYSETMGLFETLDAVLRFLVPLVFLMLQVNVLKSAFTIYKNRSIGRSTSYFYSAMLVYCSTWAAYGYLKQDDTIAVSNACGVVM